jgi:anti-sigma regulatory factor (Ser/Thr protein kinase)
MQDLSLHILDLVENAIDAGARTVRITIREDLKADRLEIEIADDGKGMDEETVKKALDPFFTTKRVRNVGLGLSLFREAARTANGDLSLQSKAGQGTTVKATFQHSHVDRKPLGDLAATMTTLVVGHPEIRFVYRHRKDARRFRFDTAKLKAKIEPAAMSTVELARLIASHLQAMRQLG